MPAITAALKARINALRRQFAGDMENYVSVLHDDGGQHGIDDGQDYGMVERKRPDWLTKEPGAWDYVGRLKGD